MISSPSNEKIKYIKKLRDRKYRDQFGVFLIEGKRLVFQAIQSTALIETIYWSPEIITDDLSRTFLSIARAHDIDCVEVSEQVFSSISQREGPKGLAAVVRRDVKKVDELEGRLRGIWVGLYAVADPGNLGTIMRTLDAIGGTGIFLIGGCTDPYHPNATRASMGSLFSLKIVECSDDEFIKLVENSRIKVIGASDSGSISFRDFQYSGEMILLMGSEREGIPVAMKNHCSEFVRIPMKGVCDSLNLAIATSVILYEIQGQIEKEVERVI